MQYGPYYPSNVTGTGWTNPGDAAGAPDGNSATATVNRDEATGLLTADTFVRASNPTTAFGSNALLEVDNSPVKHAFLRFDVTGVGSHPVASARLRLQAANVAGAASDSGGRVHRTTCGWNESTLTWNTPPPPIDPGVLASSGAVAPGQVVEFEVKAALTAGDGAYCFALDSTSGNGVDYGSSAGPGLAPALVITLAP